MDGITIAEVQRSFAVEQRMALCRTVSHTVWSRV